MNAAPFLVSSTRRFLHDRCVDEANVWPPGGEIELEGILMDNQNINDVAVIGVDLKEEHTEAPRAYIVPAPGVKRDEVTAQEIIKWMDGKVAYYKKLRGGVRFVDEIPKSAAGKILRRVLKDKAREEEKKKESGKAKL